jgi:hypothetical protein
MDDIENYKSVKNRMEAFSQSKELILDQLACNSCGTDLLLFTDVWDRDRF